MTRTVRLRGDQRRPAVGCTERHAVWCTRRDAVRGPEYAESLPGLCLPGAQEELLAGRVPRVGGRPCYRKDPGHLIFAAALRAVGLPVYPLISAVPSVCGRRWPRRSR